jgi:hypothetical protein
MSLLILLYFKEQKSFRELQRVKFDFFFLSIENVVKIDTWFMLVDLGAKWIDYIDNVLEGTGSYLFLTFYWLISKQKKENREIDMWSMKWEIESI